MIRAEERTHLWIFRWTQVWLVTRTSLIDSTAKMTLKEIITARISLNHIHSKR